MFLNNGRIQLLSKKCKDHLNNQFSSIAEMCRYWEIKTSLFESRIKNGWSIKKALITPTGTIHKGNKKCIDHLGNEFKSIKEMCIFHNFPYSTCKDRLKLNWSIEKILTTPIKETFKMCKDHLGNEFISEKQMSEFHNIPYKTYWARRYVQHLSKKEALTKPLRENSKECVDHLGNKFETIDEMCRKHKIFRPTYDARIRAGLSIKDALTNPVKEINKNSWTDHLNNEFSTLKEMCKFHNMPYKLCWHRINNSNYSIEEALTIPINMTLGEHRVRQSLKKYNISYIHNKTIKTIFKKLNFNIDWNEFLSELQSTLAANNINWSKSKIEKLRPDFVLYRDKDNKITGVIEFDGEQHQNFIEYFFKTIEEFLKRSDADFVKNSLWEYLNIPMLRIRHDQIDLIDNMILDFINNPEKYIINHNTYLSEDEYWEGLKDTLKELKNNENLGYSI